MIFNKDNNGSEELFRLTGIFERSTAFAEIEPDLQMSIDRFCRMIGKKVYEKAESMYTEGEDNELIRRVQTPIAFSAMLSYFENNTVSHGNDGRKVKINKEAGQMAWQWMIDRDSEMLRRKASETLDDLIRFLEEENLPEWADSPMRETLSASWIKSLQEFEAVMPIDHSYYFFYTLVPFVIEAQRKWFLPIFKDRYPEVPTADDLAGAFLLAKNALPLLAMVTALRRLSLSVLPTGVVRRFASQGQTMNASTPATAAEMERYMQMLIDDAMELIDDVKEAVTPSGGWDGYPLVPENDPCNKFFRT